MLVPAHQGPAFFAEAVGEVLSNAAARTPSSSAAGRRRIAELEAVTPDATVLDALLEVV